MTKENLSSEPSMDEILASIRQIISDDSKSKPLSPANETNEDILDLTHLLPEEASSRQKNKDYKNPSRENKQMHTTLLEKTLKTSSVEKKREVSPSDDFLVSRFAVSETADALQPLTSLAQERKGLLAEGLSSQMVENQLREILKPLLKEWLDTNLPLLVRWVVNEQVEKIIRQGGIIASETKREK